MLKRRPGTAVGENATPGSLFGFPRSRTSFIQLVSRAGRRAIRLLIDQYFRAELDAPLQLQGTTGSSIGDHGIRQS
jgi:hypothetical protein